MKYSPLISSPTMASDKSDTLGAFASGLCLVHCLATPLIFVVQTCSASCCEAGPFWWSMIDYFFLVISILAVYHSAKNTSLKWMPLALYLTWIVLTLFIVNEKFQFFYLNHLLLYLPAMCLIGLHLYNRKYCRCDTDQCCVSESV